MARREFCWFRVLVELFPDAFVGESENIEATEVARSRPTIPTCSEIPPPLSSLISALPMIRSIVS